MKIRLTITYKSLQTILSTIILLWINAGNFTFIVDRIPSYVKLSIVFLWFIITYSINKNFFALFLNHGWPIIVFDLLLLFSHFIGNSDYYNQYFMVFIYITILTLVVSYYFYFGDENSIRFLLIILTIDILVVTIHSIIALLQNPILARAISTSAEVAESFLGGEKPKGIGGYGLCYEIVLLTPVFCLLCSLKIRNTIIKYLIALLFLIYLFEAQITMALILYVIAFFCTEFLIAPQTIRGFTLKAFFLVAIILFTLNIENIINFVIPYAGNDLANRLVEFNYFVKFGRAGTGDVATRINLYQESIDAFLRNPFFGNMGSKPFGNHSTFFDLLATFGLFGLFGFYGLFNPIVLIKKYFRTEKRNNIVIIITLFVYSFISILNVSVGSELMTALFIILPLVLKLLNFSKAEEERGKI